MSIEKNKDNDFYFKFLENWCQQKNRKYNYSNETIKETLSKQIQITQFYKIMSVPEPLYESEVRDQKRNEKKRF